ncbi:hypothetical protein AB0J94_25280 [Micromonospora noduli]|uniref:hypothetical protein n=1 Tax=Micromonospora noduli TaxID=709876 RepID=UPI003418B404
MHHHAKALLALVSDDPAVAAEIADMLLAVPTGAPLPDRDTIARRVRAGLPVTVTVTTTVGEYLQSWLASRRSLSSVQPNTLLAYESHIRVHLVPHLGAIALVKLRVEHVEAMFAAIADRSTAIEIARQSDEPTIRASVRGLRTTKPASMHRIRATLRKALNDAIRRGNNRLIDFNPAAHIELPSGVRPKARAWTTKAVQRCRDIGERPSPVMVWTPQQAGAFLDHAEEHDIALYPLFALIHRGLRRGEAVGLTDIAVDLDNSLISVNHGAAYYRCRFPQEYALANEVEHPRNRLPARGRPHRPARRVAGIRVHPGPPRPNDHRHVRRPTNGHNATDGRSAGHDRGLRRKARPVPGRSRRWRRPRTSHRLDHSNPGRTDTSRS